MLGNWLRSASEAETSSKSAFGIEEGPESYKPKWIALHDGDTYKGFSSYGSFHQGFPVRIGILSKLA